jgi:hypothetical protein
LFGGKIAVDRADWQALAEERILAAQTLLAAQQWSSAYYLAGYAVECGLKSCIVAYVSKNIGILFTDRRLSDKCFSHNFDELIRVAGLEDAKNTEIAGNAILADNWAIVDEWTEKSRYERKTQSKAEELYAAITDNTNGVLPWIRTYW